MPRKQQRYAPRQGLQELPALLPLPGRIRLLQYSGGSLRSPPANLPVLRGELIQGDEVVPHIPQTRKPPQQTLAIPAVSRCVQEYALVGSFNT